MQRSPITSSTHGVPPLPELLGVGQVMERYAVGDRRTARRIMEEIGALRVGRQVYVRLDELIAFEEGQRAQSATSSRRRARVPARSRAGRALEPGWWRAEQK
jgi:hypothetical protein